MNFPTREHQGFQVIALPANLRQNDWLALRERLQQQFLDHGKRHLVIDCEAVGDLPSIAFGVFCGLARDLTRMGGSFHLVHVSERIRHVLTRTHLDQLIPVRGTLHEVVTSSST